MDSHVSFEIYSLPRGEFTLSAIERLFFRVCQNVVPEGTDLFAGEFTMGAIERIFSRVNPHVIFEATSYCEGVVTLYALERFFQSVSALSMCICSE